MKSTGMLIAIDMYNCSDEVLADSTGVEEMLHAAAEMFAMQPRTAHTDKEDGSQEYSVGVTCKQGHVMMHLYPALGFLTIDVFTCNQNADPDGMARHLRHYFNPDKLKITYLERGDFGNEADMKPRRKNTTKTVRRVRSLGNTMRKIILKPRGI